MDGMGASVKIIVGKDELDEGRDLSHCVVDERNMR